MFPRPSTSNLPAYIKQKQEQEAPHKEKAQVEVESQVQVVAQWILQTKL
jgi:hypothetical protein